MNPVDHASQNYEIAKIKISRKGSHMSSHDKDMNVVRIPVGDLSGDGHDKIKDHDFLVPSKFTKETLIENYNKNKILFGFGLKDFATEYEDFYIPRDKLEILISHGFQYDDTGKDQILIGSLDMAKFAMFFVGHGLNGFSYAIVPEPDFTLFGHWSEPDCGIGYGVLV